MTTRFAFPTDIRFGFGAIEELPLELRTKKIKRPMVVTDSTVAKLDFMQELCHKLAQDGLQVSLFDGVFGNPDDAQVEAGCHNFHKAQADALLAIGGGASMDVAKAIALLATNGGKVSDYDGSKKDARALTKPLPFLVAVPTTAGTGSEVGRSTVISDRASHKKRVIFDPALLPQLVIADPMLTQHLPAHITAATGMDALTHLIESFSVQEFHPMCDGIALEGLRLIGQSLEASCQAAREKDLGKVALLHRRNMLAASMMGAVAFQKGLGVNHSLAHALSTVCDLHHGLANALVLPHVLHFNQDAVGDKFERILKVLNLPQRELSTAISHLLERIHIRKGLSAHGVQSIHVEPLVEIAFLDGCHETNPKPVSKDDMRRIINHAL